MAESRVTQAGAYVEVGDTQTAVTQGLVYVETGPRERVRATQGGVYVELGIKSETRASQAYIYNELCHRIYRQCTRIWYNGVEITEYTYGLDIAAQAGRADIRTLCSTGTAYVSLPAEWELTLGGMWAMVVDNQLGADLVAGEAWRKVQILFEQPPHYSIWYEWPRAQMRRYQIDAAPASGVEWAAGLIFDENLRRTWDI